MKRYRTRASRARATLARRILVGAIAAVFLFTLVGSIFIRS